MSKGIKAMIGNILFLTPIIATVIVVMSVDGENPIIGFLFAVSVALGWGILITGMEDSD